MHRAHTDTSAWWLATRAGVLAIASAIAVSAGAACREDAGSVSDEDRNRGISVTNHTLLDATLTLYVNDDEIVNFSVPAADTITVDGDIRVPEDATCHYRGALSEETAHYQVVGPVLIDADRGASHGLVREIIIDADENVRIALARAEHAEAEE